MPFDPNDTETKAALKAAVESAVSEAVEGLKTKNTELLGKVKKLQKNAEIDPDDFNALQTELDQTQDKLKSTEKTLKTVTKENETIKGQYETESKVAHDLLVDTGLSNALLENGVKNPAYLKAAKALLASQVKLEDDNGNRVAKVGDKALADHIKEWAGSDEGKAFVDAPGNKGGQAPGGDPNNPGNLDLEKMPAESRLSAINEAAAA